MVASLTLVVLALVAGCTDTILNPEQVVPTTGFYYEANSVLSDGTVLQYDTGSAISVIHVEPGGEGGDGTYSSPFGDLARALSAAKSGDIVLVHHGANPGLGDFEVPDGVRVLGAGPYQLVSTSQFGTMALPLTGSTPLIRVEGSARMGNNSEISGFDFRTETGKAVWSDGVSNVIVRENRFSEVAEQGIYLVNTTGDVVVEDNEVLGTQGNQFEPQPGIFLEYAAGELNLLIRNNSVFNTSGDGIKVVSTGAASTTAVVDSNTVRKTFGAGIKFFSFKNARVTTTVAYNVISENVPDADQDGSIRIGSFNTIVATANVIGNELFDNRSNGIFIGTEDSSNVTVNVLDNEITNNVGNGIFLGAQQVSTEQGIIANNIIKETRQSDRAPGFPTGHGIFVGTISGGKNPGTLVVGNRAIDNETNGFFFASFNAGDLNLTVADNIAADNTLNGMEFNTGLNIPPPGRDTVTPPLPPPGTNKGTFVVTGNSVTGNRGEGPPGLEGGGVMILSFNGSIHSIYLERNRINNNGSAPGAFAGLGLLAFDQSRLRASLRQNTLALNQAAPGLNAQVLAAVPPALPPPEADPEICLRLDSNVSDTGYFMNRGLGTSFRADTTGNLGTFVIPYTAEIDELGGCPVPSG